MHQLLEQPEYTKRARGALMAAALAFFLVTILGGVVRVTGSGGACADWPTCFGAWTPPSEQMAFLDYLHRAASGLAVGLLLISAWMVSRSSHLPPAVSRLVYIALAFVGLQIGLGAWSALARPVVGSPLISLIHLGLSMLILAAGAGAYMMAVAHNPKGTRPAGITYRTPFARLSLLSLGMLAVLLLSGALLSNSPVRDACATWPFCGLQQVFQTPWGWLHLAHRFLVALTAGVLALLAWRAWRSQRSQIVVLVATTASLVLYLAQSLLGAKMVQGFPAYLLVIHEATAVALWVSAIVQVTAVGLAGRTSQEEAAEEAAAVRRERVLRDLLQLTKPIVVVLLLVTTFAGMVIGGKAWPAFGVTFWTLLGGFMAAGGSGAINQYIDRFDDRKMQRTQKRPLPDGRLTAGEGLAFGVGLTLASFYIMVAMVNLLAALLTLAGIIYYVLLYSIFLKKTTVQNIIIGGGAGAIPPLVGWAAATGSLNIPSLFLFAVVFMWTPPHFWALALVRRKDYARAGVPMLPVVRGERETRWQILLYTIELVGLTLFLPLFGLGGVLYLAGAVALGLWLLATAWRLWKQEGNKVAWKMYRYSSMYLAFLFVVLMVDALL